MDAGTNVLTLRLDDELHGRFEALRREHFPPERNRIPAHLTLFHRLPDEVSIEAQLESVARETAVFAVGVTGLRSLGRGVAYTVDSAELLRMHGLLARAFAAHLTAQDRQGFRPHVVVQNKVTAEAARLLLVRLQAEFAPFAGEAVGMDLWRYLGGPWGHLRTFWFGR